ncbi:MAG: type II secretion system minor pseudopilin GspK [Steroidobacteraceae bacterium]
MNAPGPARIFRPCGSPPSRQRGIAMLVAILLVALGTIIAAAVAYESAMTARRGSATLSFDESLLVGQGAEALAAYGLKTYFQQLGAAGGSGAGAGGSGPIVSPTQQWAEPYGPVEVVPGVTLEASLEDLQGRFNVNWLVVADGGPNAGKPDPVMVDSFKYLLQLATVDPKWADMLVDWIDKDDQAQTQGAEDGTYLSQNPPYRAANQYITSTSELLALPGFGRENYAKLAPYITALPPQAKLNICSAKAIVLDSLNPGHQDYSSDAASFEKNRAAAPPNTCFPDTNAFKAPFDQQRYGQISGKIEQTSHYFRLSSLVTIGTTEFNLYSLLFMNSQFVIFPIQRSFSPD